VVDQPIPSLQPDLWRGRRVLLTGHTGFKGSWLAVWLHALGAEVRGLALAPSTTPSIFDALKIGDLVDSTIGDVRDGPLVERVVQEFAPSVVFHLAAQPLVRASYVTPVETFATNVMGTVHVLDACREVPSVRAVVCVTTDKCYENREWSWGYRENEPMGGHDPYSASKGAAEIAIAAYRRSFFHAATSAKVASARAGNVIGGGDWSADRLVPDAARAFAEGKPVEIRSPRATRPWQHVLEPLSGYLAIAEALLDDRAPVAADAWNLGPGDEDVVTVGALLDRFVRAWGDGAHWIDRSAESKGPHEATLLKLDVSKARAKLGWQPRWRLDRALAATAEWYRAFYAGSGAEAMRAMTRAQIDRYVAG
jgi:CDP-glucose 4,6-dehydratase